MQKEVEKKEFEEKIIEVARVSRTVKGGRRMRFRVLVVIGNKHGKVGYGVGKSNEVAGAAAKAVIKAKQNLIDVPIINGTIPHEITVKYGSAKLFLKPASPGTSIIAGGSVRSVVEMSGIKNILSKIIGSSNKINNVKATFLAFSKFNSSSCLQKRSENEELDESQKSKEDNKKESE